MEPEASHFLSSLPALLRFFILAFRSHRYLKLISTFLRELRMLSHRSRFLRSSLTFLTLLAAVADAQFNPRRAIISDEDQIALRLPEIRGKLVGPNG